MAQLRVRTEPLNRHLRAAPQLFERLRERIIALDLLPGMPLSRVELMDEFGTSVTPIRDALQRLADEGLVEIFPQHATVVSRIDLAHAAQTQFLRRSIELEVVTTLVRVADEETFGQLHTILTQHRAALNDLAAFKRLDMRFHQAMYEAAGVPDLWALVRSRSGHIDRLRALHLPIAGKAKAILRDHGRILEALEARNAAAAQRAVHEHLSGTLTQVAAIAKRHPDYVRES
ncbi:GntR family transcriptional regulator [Roseiterribacter gracilis]|uniref:Transcriptional regulator n=1 Tax=Roseiterribacter gracilis TaxID=2812848 RepID=A0A8S8XHU3_9PROT|nr:transcriptional regulator [Rhodospirillales bacterium TMPK1]